jgi:phosphoglucosamine mutase
MDSETVMMLGRAVAHVMRSGKGRHRILIGKDTRVSGYMLETALASGICSMGVDVLLVGPLPTPGVAFMTRSMRADAGVMISASHNSYEDNGIKFFGPDGFKLADETEDEIEQLLHPGQLDQLRAVPEVIGKAARVDDAVGRYIVYLKSCIERTCKLDGLKLVVDSANGAAYRVAPSVFSELGAEVIETGGAPNGRNINKDCGSLHPEVISRMVKVHGADCGIAFDGDADRVIFCDESGEILDGDAVLALCALNFREQGLLNGDAVVGTVMSNMGLEVGLKAEGITLHRTDVGDRYVLQRMLEEGLNLGGEQSGHIIALDHNTTGDGILTALLVLSAMQAVGKPLSAFRDIIKRYPQELINVKVSQKPPLEGIAVLQDAIAKAQSRMKDTGRILVRYSGTEKKVRVMVECEDAALCKEIAEGTADNLRRELSEA